MNVFLDIQYEIVAIKSGNKLALRYPSNERVEIEVREVSPEAAPVALSWGNRKTIEKRWDAYDWPLVCGDEEGRSHTRWFEGRHWLKLFAGHIGGPDAKWNRRGLTAADVNSADAGGASRMVELLLGSRKLSPKASVKPLPSMASVTGDGRGSALAYFAENRSDLISIDGSLYMSCAQPATRIIHPYWRGPLLSSANLQIDFRHRHLDGSAGYYMKNIALPLADWRGLRQKILEEDRLPYGERTTAIAPPTVHMPDSLDPDVDGRRAVDGLVKSAFYAAKPTHAFHKAAAEFFDVKTNQRSELLVPLLSKAERLGQPLPSGYVSTLIETVERIEDQMGVDVPMSVRRQDQRSARTLLKT